MTSHHGARVLNGQGRAGDRQGPRAGPGIRRKVPAAMGADVAIHGMRENGPAEYGEGSTLTAVAEEVAAAHGVRTVRVLGDLTLGADIARVVETTTQRTRADRYPRPQRRRRHRRQRRQAGSERCDWYQAKKTCARCWIATCSARS